MTNKISITGRLRRVLAYFSAPTSGWIFLALAVITGSVLEPMIPALLKPLLDDGFKSREINLWLVPLFIVGLFTLRSGASFLADIALARIAQTSLHSLRKKMFDCITGAELDFVS
jgi:subfamily B ATP-binding cassette protein MsbA